MSVTEQLGYTGEARSGTSLPREPADQDVDWVASRPSPWLVAVVDEKMDEAAPLADRLIRRWVRLASRHARVRRVDTKVWVADVVGLPGAWSDGPSREAAEANLPSVLYDWVRMKLDDGDRDIPPMHGLKLVIDE